MDEVKPIKTVVAAVIYKDDKVFAAMRSEDGFMLNKWEFPGGKLEKGEDDVVALKRELKEELGIEIDNIRYFMRVEYEYEKFILHMNTYKCETPDETLNLNVHKKGGFFAKEEIALLDFLPADKPIIERLLLEW